MKEDEKMLDIKLIRETPDMIRKNYERRHDPELLKKLDKVIKIDQDWRDTKTKMQELQHEMNLKTTEIAKTKDKKAIAQMKKLKEETQQLEAIETDLRNQLRKNMFLLPNLLHESVPDGKDEHDNVPIKYVGKPPKFDFKPKDHLELTTNLGLIDPEAGAKAAGSGLYYLKGGLALLDMALQKYAVEFLTKKGFTLIEPPMMLNRQAFDGVTSPKIIDEDMYKIENEDLYLIGTSEHALCAMFMDKVLEKKDLPIKLCGISACFRKEAGTHGKYMKGLYRMHQFNKIEQIVVCEPDGWKLFDELQKNTEEMLNELGIVYRVVNLCTGDMGKTQTKTLDIEVWMVDGQYRENGSNSNCLDYQARRLNVKYEDGKEKKYVYFLNNTGIATSRTMIAILEQNQQADGTIKIPKVLWPYMCGMKVLEKVKQ